MTAMMVVGTIRKVTRRIIRTISDSGEYSNAVTKPSATTGYNRYCFNPKTARSGSCVRVEMKTGRNKKQTVT